VSAVVDAHAKKGWFVPQVDRDIDKIHEARYSGKAIFLPGET